MKEDILKELKEASVPLRNFLKKHFNVECIAIVDDDGVKILSGELFIPKEKAYRINNDKPL